MSRQQAAEREVRIRVHACICSALHEESRRITVLVLSVGTSSDMEIGGAGFEQSSVVAKMMQDPSSILLTYSNEAYTLGAGASSAQIRTESKSPGDPVNGFPLTQPPGLGSFGHEEAAAGESGHSLLPVC